MILDSTLNNSPIFVPKFASVTMPYQWIVSALGFLAALRKALRRIQRRRNYDSLNHHVFQYTYDTKARENSRCQTRFVKNLGGKDHYSHGDIDPSGSTYPLTQRPMTPFGFVRKRADIMGRRHTEMSVAA